MKQIKKFLHDILTNTLGNYFSGLVPTTVIIAVVTKFFKTNIMQNISYHLLLYVFLIGISTFIIYQLFRQVFKLKDIVNDLDTKLKDTITDLSFKELIYNYRSEMFYRAMANPYSLTKEHTNDSSKLAIPFVFYENEGVFAPISLPTEKRKEKEYFRGYLKNKNVPPNEMEILVKKYTIDNFE